MKKHIYIFCLMIFLTIISCSAQEIFANQRNTWLQKAEEAKPALHETIVHPISIVKAVADKNAYQGWRYEKQDEIEKLYTTNFKELKSVTVDFGKHLTGYFSFHTQILTNCEDAPVRLKFTFAETPAELNTPLDPWKSNMSRAWMQDEIITLTQLNETVQLPRRFAFRYLKIELLASSVYFDFAIDKLTFRAVSSAGEVKTDLPPQCPAIIKDINRIGIETLRECMQTVYEDGPKRDQRLWVGDLYLESLANRYSFKNFQLTKRCLYLFAGLADEKGIVIANIFEHPEPHPQKGQLCLTYSMLFNSTLLEYLKDTNDYETANDLWCVARRQMEYALNYVNKDYLFDPNLYAPNWFFLDWRDGLDTHTPMQGAILFALNETYELACMLGKEKEVSEWPLIAKKMKKAARQHLYDKQQKVFISGANKQISVLSQAWMIIGGVTSEKEGQQAIRQALNNSQCVMPGTPYGTHYLIEAMVKSGMHKEAHTYLTEYWGGMVKKGADTFWEAYDPKNDYISPYGFFPVNSACHAWSCTPVYFIHKYPEIFQR